MLGHYFRCKATGERPLCIWDFLTYLLDDVLERPCGSIPPNHEMWPEPLRRSVDPQFKERRWTKAYEFLTSTLKQASSSELLDCL